MEKKEKYVIYTLGGNPSAQKKLRKKRTKEGKGEGRAWTVYLPKRISVFANLCNALRKTW